MILVPEIYLGTRSVSAENPTYIIAEIGVNHNGQLSIAHDLIDAAKIAGADAVKFQTYLTEELVLSGAPQADYQIRGSNFYDQSRLLKELELPFDAFIELRNHCVDVGIDFMSTAFDSTSLEFVASLSPVCLKWPSGELTNIPLLRRARRLGLPVLLSTGMGSLSEVSRAVDVLGHDVDKVILQCVSAYPANIEDQNLRALPVMQACFGCPVGFSDHTIGPYASIAARALGMAVLEKHFTLDTKMEGPDHAASIEPHDFAQMVGLLRQIEKGLGDGIKRSKTSEDNVKNVARKSLVYARDLAKGSILHEDDLTAKRPGTGVSPENIDNFVGLSLSRDVKCNDLLSYDHVR